jgi:hypothetical protein
VEVRSSEGLGLIAEERQDSAKERLLTLESVQPFIDDL